MFRITKNKNTKKVPFLKSYYFKKYKLLYLFMLPSIILLIVFNYLPMVGISMAFKDYDPIIGFFKSDWVGFANFKELFITPNIEKAFANTLIISALKLVFTFPAPIIFALLLNELRSNKFKRSVQTISYFPYFISWVIVSGIWYKILSPDAGIVNGLLLSFGIIDNPVNFMQSKLWFYPILIFTEIWKNLGFSAILYLAAIAGIDQEQYEASCVDGANRFHRAIHITIPGISGTVVLMFIMAVAGLLNAGFDQLWTMGNLAVNDIAEVLDTLVLRYLSTGTIHDLSIGAALGFFKSFVAVILFVIANSISKKISDKAIV